MEREKPPPLPPQREVLVVGAGPVGLVAACELVRRGVRVRIVDKAPALPTTSRALALFPRTLETFALMGGAAPFLEAGRKLEGISLYNEHGLLARLDFGALSTPYPFILSLPQNRTEELLAGQLTALGVEVERGVELIGFAQDEEGVRAVLRHPVSRAGGAAEERVRVAWLLGCDGAHSTVRHLLGAAFEGKQRHEAFALADARVHDALSPEQAHFFFSRQGMLGVVPFREGYARIIINRPGVTAEEAAKRPDPTLADFQSCARERGAESLRLSDPLWISHFNVSCRMVRAYRHGRVFLAGDAAHIHSPAGGQGMNTGIQDAFNLAWKLALVARGRSSSALLDTYGKERAPVARGVLRFSDGLTRLATTRNTLARRVRDWVLPALFRSRAFSDRAARRMAELDVRYRHGWLSEDHGGEPLRAGDRAPDALFVDLLTRKRVRLFGLLREGRHLLLAFEGLHAKPEARAEIESLLRELEAPLADVMTIHPVVRAFAFPEAAALLDRSGAVHLLYDADAGGVVLIRPDGYLGFRSDWKRAGKLRAYLRRLFPA